MNPESKRLAQLISAASDSLHREMHEGFTCVNERLDRISACLDRQCVLIQTALDGLRKPKL
jgi:hypothetical protein